MTQVVPVALATSVHAALAALDIGTGDTDEQRHRIVAGDRTLTAGTASALRPVLTGALYEQWHSGSEKQEHRTMLWRDRAFERELAAAVPHRTSPVDAVLRGEPVAEPGGTGDVVVADVGRLRVRLPVGLLPAGGHRPGTEIAVQLPAIRPSLSPGFLLVSGPAGAPTTDGPLLRLYVHLERADAAVRVWGDLLNLLNEHDEPYRAKVLSKQVSYPRRDAVVAYLPAAMRHNLPGIVARLAGLPGIGDATSLFVRRAAPGLGLAWEPEDRRQGWERMSFGQHRAAVIADGVARHLAGDKPLDEAVTEALQEASIDPADPARNVNSPSLLDDPADAGEPLVAA